MTPLFGLIFLAFAVIFVFGFVRSLMTGWRMTRMVDKVFTLAEQQIDQKLADGPAAASRAAG